MSTGGWLLLAVVGVVLVGFLVMQTTTGGLKSGTQSHGLLDNIASITGNIKGIGSELERAFPSWWGDSTPDPTTSNLDSYASSSGFIDRSTLE